MVDGGFKAFRLALIGDIPSDLAQHLVSARSQDRDNADWETELLSVNIDFTSSHESPDGAVSADIAKQLGDLPIDAAIIWFEGMDPAPLRELSVEAWQRGIARNAHASWVAAKAVVPLLTPRQGSCVIFTSRAAREALPGGGVFGIAKTMEANLARSIAAEAADLGVRVNLLSPSPEPAGRETSAQIAESIAFLIGSRAASIGAATLAIDAKSVNAATTRALFDIPAIRPGHPVETVRAARLRAIVTGGAGCIGAATVRALDRLARAQGQDGLDVIVADIDEQRLATTVQALCAEGISAVASVADLGQPETPDRLVAEAVERFGGLDFIHSNAGYGIVDPALQAAEAQWRKIVEINLTSTWRLALAGFPHLRASGGSLVATSSIASFLASKRGPMYSATKAALNRLVAQLALEWGVDGVRANVISPGSIDTPMNQLAKVSEAERAGIASTYPIPRFGTADEVAEAVAFLASDRASYISGQNIVVDGGLIQGMR